MHAHIAQAPRSLQRLTAILRRNSGKDTELVAVCASLQEVEAAIERFLAEEGHEPGQVGPESSRAGGAGGGGGGGGGGTRAHERAHERPAGEKMKSMTSSQRAHLKVYTHMYTHKDP